MSFRLFFALIAATLTLVSAHADPSPELIPSSLAEWAQWIQARHPQWACAPMAGSDRHCDWPTALRYTITDAGASFTLTGEMLAPGEIVLPRSAQAIPTNLTIKPSGHLITRGDGLIAYLPAGPFTITGDLPRSSGARAFPAPDNTGLISVSPMPGDSILSRRDGMIRLDERSSAHVRDSLVISVARRLVDGSPMELETEIQLSISGKARMVALGAVLPKETLPVLLDSPLPAQVTSEGSLSFQARQGQHVIRITSIASPTLKALVFQGTPSPWPRIETFAFSARPSFRSVSISGGEALHADAAIIPPEWRSDAVYTITPNATITVTEISRGEQNSPQPQLNLQREIWLSFDGSHLFHKDELSGTSGRATRLNMLAGNHVGRAMVDGAPLLITKAPDSNLKGIEVRDQQVGLTAIGWQSSTEPLLAHGWDAPMNAVTGILHLPPAWQLLTIRGASSVSGAWLDSWTLLDIFVCILIIAASRTVVNLRVAVVLSLMLVVTHGEFLAPKMLIVHLLILLAWRQALSGQGSVWEKLNTVLLVSTGGAWLLQVLTFEKLQLTQLLFPQLQAGTRYRTVVQEIAMAINSSLTVWPMMLLALGLMVVAVYYVSRGSSTMSRVLRSALMLVALAFVIPPIIGYVFLSSPPTARSSFSPQAMNEFVAEQSSTSYMAFSRNLSKETPLQFKNILEDKHLAAGPALPTWKWKQHSFNVSGPVSSEHVISIVALSPQWTRLLSFARLIIVAVLAVLLIRQVKVALALALTALILLHPSTASAQYPPQSLLKQLEDQLQKTLCSGDECGTVEALQLSFRDGVLDAALHVSSRGRSAIRLPGPLSVLLPVSVTIDGAPAGLRRDDSDYLTVMVPNGHHQVHATFSVPVDDSFTVSLPDPLPLHASVQASGWTYVGISDAGIAQHNIEFNRTTGDDRPAIAPSLLGNWIVVRRTFNLAEQFSVSTTVRRTGDSSKPVTVRVPMLPQERIVSGAAEVSNDATTIEFPVGQEEVEYRSTIPIAEELTVTAPTLPFMSEEWRFQCSPLIHCDISGVPYQMLEQPVFNPFPGESLVVRIAHLEAIPGEALSIDEVSHAINWGSALLSGTIRATARVTQQSNLEIALPAGTTIQSITMDGVPSGSRAIQARTAIALPPGTHALELAYHYANNPGSVFSVPPIGLSAPSNNITVTVAPPPDRWILWIGGGLFGPSVVYWGKLIGVIILCLLLTSVGLYGGSASSAVLLGVGLSSLPMIILWIPLLWLGLIAKLPAISRKQASHPWQPPVMIASLSLLAGLSLFLLYRVVEIGLLLSPPMLIAGANSTAYQLRWLFDISSTALPMPWVISLPMWCWRAFSLVWATWLVVVVLGWIKQTIACAKGLALGGE